MSLYLKSRLLSCRLALENQYWTFVCIKTWPNQGDEKDPQHCMQAEASMPNTELHLSRARCAEWSQRIIPGVIYHVYNHFNIKSWFNWLLEQVKALMLVNKNASLMLAFFRLLTEKTEKIHTSDNGPTERYVRVRGDGRWIYDRQHGFADTNK